IRSDMRCIAQYLFRGRVFARARSRRGCGSYRPNPPLAEPHRPGRKFFFSSRRRHTRSVSAFLLNRSSDLFMIIPMLCVTIFVILVVWFLLPRVARLMIHTSTAISIFVCLSMVQLMAVFISMRCTLCGHFLQVALTLILVVGYAIAAS